MYRTARGGRSCERFGGYKTINRIPLPLPLFCAIFGFTCDKPVVSAGGGKQGAWAKQCITSSH